MVVEEDDIEELPSLRFAFGGVTESLPHVLSSCL